MQRGVPPRKSFVMGACASRGDSATGPKTANFQVTAVDSALIAVHASADATILGVNTLNGILSRRP
jgi:hypothetical protein